MNTRLYVGNLQWSVDDIGLQNAFSNIGKVKTATVVLDRNTGRSRGFGFVEMSTEEEANKIIEKMNGEFFNGRQLMVREAKPEGSKIEQEFEKVINQFIMTAKLQNETDFSVGEKHFIIIRDR